MISKRIANMTTHPSIEILKRQMVRGHNEGLERAVIANAESFR